MATTPERPAPPPGAAATSPPPQNQSQQATKPASTEEKEPEEKVVPKDEVKLLFQSGHRLKKKGDPPEKWIAAVRLHDTLCLARPLDDELEKSVLDHELVLVAD